MLKTKQRIGHSLFIVQYLPNKDFNLESTKKLISLYFVIVLQKWSLIQYGMLQYEKYFRDRSLVSDSVFL